MGYFQSTPRNACAATRPERLPNVRRRYVATRHAKQEGLRRLLRDVPVGVERRAETFSECAAMMMWLIRLLIGCRHEWEVIRSGKVYEDDNYKMPSRFYYHLKCNKCGKIVERII